MCIWQRAPQSATLAWPVFRTCRREIAFVERHSSVPADAEPFSGEAAYAHLLQVICGLHSPIVGETEVMHQFRVFVDGLAPEHHGVQSLGRRLLADARRVRAQYLGSLGSRSYGSAVRRQVRDCDRVAVIGTGILARAVLPFVADDRRLVDVYGRKPAFDSTLASLCYHPLDQIASRNTLEGNTALVVAAPVDAALIARVGRLYASLACVIDLRGETDVDPVPPIAPVVSLADVFSEMRRAAQTADGRVAAAKLEIAGCARAFATRAVLNPSGWHDLCA